MTPTDGGDQLKDRGMQMNPPTTDMPLIEWFREHLSADDVEAIVSDTEEPDPFVSPERRLEHQKVVEHTLTTATWPDRMTLGDIERLTGVVWVPEFTSAPAARQAVYAACICLQRMTVHDSKDPFFSCLVDRPLPALVQAAMQLADPPLLIAVIMFLVGVRDRLGPYGKACQLAATYLSLALALHSSEEGRFHEPKAPGFTTEEPLGQVLLGPVRDWRSQARQLCHEIATRLG